MAFLQDWIHRVEVGAGSKVLRWSVLGMAVVALWFFYNLYGFRNMATPEAMDAAQLARNVAEGKGYTTLFVRPLSMHLVKKVNEGRLPVSPDKAPDYARIKTPHPDLANPPVYPLVLAGLMKVLPFDYTVTTTKAFWSSDGRFWRYQPDFLIAVFNQLLFFGVLFLMYLLARRLFDITIAWVSVVVLLGTELFWRFSVSGLSTMLLLLIFTGLVWSLCALEQRVREAKLQDGTPLLLAAAAGALVGMGALTRYAFGWVIIPVVVFVVLFAGRLRIVLALTTVLVFAALLAPWVARNYKTSGLPFGTATLAVVENTSAFPEYRLARSLEPDLSRADLRAFMRKLFTNGRQIIQNDLPKLGGSWVTAFFLVGLLVPFRNPTLNRLRYFVLLCLAIWAPMQALGKTQLAEDSPEINSENLLVLLAPMVVVYGVSLFFLLLDRLALPLFTLRLLIIGGFIAVACLPMVFTFLPPRLFPVVYPPYYPPVIQTICGWMKEDDLMMSDIPWAVAWYGKRQCVWMTLNATRDPQDPYSQENFFAIDDYQKPIKALYLTPQTMDSRFLSQWVRAGEHSWGSFILESIVRREIPPDFPLRKAPAGFLPEQLFLTDWERWRKPGS